MRHIPVLLLAALLAVLRPAVAHADVLYGLVSESGTTRLYEIDAATGARTPIFDTGIASTALGTHAFDPVRRRFFFSSFTSLYAIDIPAATMTSLGVFASNIEYDPATDTIYGLENVAGQYTLFAIDPDTGAQSPVVATGITSTAAGISAFDPGGRRFFFASLLPTLQLWRIDLAGPTVTPLGSFAGNTEFDVTTNLLYGSTVDSGQVKIFAIDPLTGVQTQVLATGVSNSAAGSSSFDPIGRRYFFSSLSELFAANLTTATVTSLGSLALPIEFFRSPALAGAQGAPALDWRGIAVLVIAIAVFASRRLMGS